MQIRHRSENLPREFDFLGRREPHRFGFGKHAQPLHAAATIINLPIVNPPLRIIDLRRKQRLLRRAATILEPVIDDVFATGDFSAPFLVLEAGVRAFGEIPQA
ncbi:hypothetical protein BMJ22_22100 [Sinorhizobium medicae]|nr:hypothetical protein BMJ22_22100 [Sinorhizobium medicae]